MEITDLSVYVVNVGVVDLDDGGIAPYVTNHGQVDDVNRAVVRVETDAGITGWGEMRTFLSPEATRAILEEGIAPWVLGRSPYELESLRRQLFIEYTNADMFFAPVETACWDIVGTDLGKPIYELLGGWTAPSVTGRTDSPDRNATQRVDAAYCVGILPPEESRAHAARALEEGYGVLKTKAGRDWRTDVDRVVAMHDEVDGELDFRLDPNQGWSLEDAVRVCATLEDAGVYLQYLEQPIRVDAHASLTRLRQRTAQPIGPNEDTYIARNLREMIERGALDAAVLARGAGIDPVVTTTVDAAPARAAAVHVASAIPDVRPCGLATGDALEADVAPDPAPVEAGAVTVPDGPGVAGDAFDNLF